MRHLLSRALLAALPALVAIACSGTDAANAPPADGGVLDSATSLPADAGTDASDGAVTGCQAITPSIGPLLDTAAKDPAITDTPDFTLILETEDGRSYAHSNGASTATTVYESASTSKWISAVIILDLVDQGLLTLDSKPHDLLPFWLETTVTLRQLLSFTDGFYEEPKCLNLGTADFETCVASIYATNAPTAPPAGTVYQYLSTHLQIAGLMAMKAMNVTSWKAVFDAWKASTKLFPTAKYDLPSETNPRLAGGVHWTATEYLGFLRALAKGQTLKPTRVGSFIVASGFLGISNV